MSFVAAAASGVILMVLAFVQHGWWGFAFLPLTLIISAAVQAAFEYGGEPDESR